MMSIRKQYCKELYQEFGYHATWLPNIKLSIGDIGIVENYQFTKLTSLKNLNINFDTEIDSSVSKLEYASKEGVSVKTKLTGSAQLPDSLLTLNDTGLIVAFNKAQAVLFKADGSSSEHLKDKVDVGKAIIKLHEKDKWDKNWVVITEIVKANSSTILIANSKNAKIELKVNSKIDINQSDITNLNANFTIIQHQDIHAKFINESEMTPLFKIMGIKGMKPFKQKFASKSKGKDIFLNQISQNTKQVFTEITPIFLD